MECLYIGVAKIEEGRRQKAGGRRQKAGGKRNTTLLPSAFLDKIDT
jgi:hypothetical protein